jgi:putative ABC transport system permease protein
VWWLSNRWLADFAYKVNLSWWLFAGPGLLILMIALATISYHTLKISSLNPTETLRTE